MSDLRRIIEVYFDVEGSRYVDKIGDAFSAPKTTMTLYRGTQITFRAHLMRADATTYFQPEVDAVWLFGIDSVYTLDHTDLVSSAADQFNIAADWGSIDIVGGKISWRADLTSATLKADLGDSATKTMYCGLWMAPVGGKYTLMAHWDILMHNVAVDPTTAQSVEGISFATVDLLDADIAQVKTPTNGLYRIKNGALQLYNPDQSKFHTITIAGAAGSEHTSIGDGEA